MNRRNTWSLFVCCAAVFWGATAFADAASQRSERLSRLEVTSYDRQDITCQLFKGSTKVVEVTAKKNKPRGKNFSAPSYVQHKKIRLNCSKGRHRMIKMISTLNMGKRMIIVRCVNSSKIRCTHKLVMDVPSSAQANNDTSNQHSASATNTNSTRSTRSTRSNRNANTNQARTNTRSNQNNPHTNNTRNNNQRSNNTQASANTENAPYKRIKIRYSNKKTSNSTCIIKTSKGKTISKMNHKAKTSKTYSVRVYKKDYGYLSASCKSGKKKVSWGSKMHTKAFNGDNYISVKCKPGKKLDCKVMKKPIGELAKEEKETDQPAASEPETSNEGKQVTFLMKNRINKPVTCTLKAGSTTFATLNIPARNETGISTQLYVPPNVGAFKLVCLEQNRRSSPFTVQTRKLLDGDATRIEGTCNHGPMCNAQLK